MSYEGLSYSLQTPPFRGHNSVGGLCRSDFISVRLLSRHRFQACSLAQDGPKPPCGTCVQRTLNGNTRVTEVLATEGRDVGVTPLLLCSWPFRALSNFPRERVVSVSRGKLHKRCHRNRRGFFLPVYGGTVTYHNPRRQKLTCSAARACSIQGNEQAGP